MLLPGISEDFVSLRVATLELRALVAAITGIRKDYTAMLDSASATSHACLAVSQSSTDFNKTLIERNGELHTLLINAVWERDRFFVDLLEQLDMSDHPVSNMTEDELIRYVLELLDCTFRTQDEVNAFYIARGEGRRFSSRARRQLDSIASIRQEQEAKTERNNDEQQTKV
jgi:hypothetical protein